MKTHQKIPTEPQTQSSLTISDTQSQKQLPTQLPSDMQFVFGFNVNTSQIVDLFEQIAEEEKFQMIQCEQSHATAIKHGKKSFMQAIDCFSLWTQGNVTAVKINIKTREKDSKRVCRIRGLVGSRKQIIQSQQLMSSKQQTIENQQLQASEQQTNPFYLQSCAAFMFHKILSNEKYGIGSLMHNSIQNFNNQYKIQTENQSKTEPMKKAIGIVQEIVGNLYKDFNYGRSQMQQIMPYCRISVQKYIFQKIHDTITALYRKKNKQIVQGYEQKKKRVLNLKASTILQQIGLRPKLWLCNLDEAELQQDGLFLSTKTAQSYKKVSKQLQRIIGTQSPRQKIKHTQIMYTTLKTLIYEHVKQQLFNMEDVIPCLILVILLTEINEIKNQIDLMMDFVNFDPCDLDSEKRLLVNLSESFNYIYRDWKL